MCQSSGHDMVLGHGGHVGTAWPIEKLNPFINELGLRPWNNVGEEVN